MYINFCYYIFPVDGSFVFDNMMYAKGRHSLSSMKFDSIASILMPSYNFVPHHRPTCSTMNDPCRISNTSFKRNSALTCSEKCYLNAFWTQIIF